MTQEMMRVKLVPAQTVKLQVESFRGPRGLSGESPQGVVRRYGSLAQMQRDDTLAEGMSCLMDGIAHFLTSSSSPCPLCLGESGKACCC